jgi:hypothetical protein
MTDEDTQLKTAYQWEAKAQWRLPPLKDELKVSLVHFHTGWASYRVRNKFTALPMAASLPVPLSRGNLSKP